MAGHSKWSQIKHKKAATDAKRSKVFTRILKEITVAARLGGGDPAGNPRLRNAISDARSQNVPNDNIERAIKKGTGELEGVSYDEISYEGYGPGGVAVLVETVTDNRNRTVSEVRHLFSKHGGNLGENGCVAWMFEKRGFFVIDPGDLDEESLMEIAVDLDAVDFSIEPDGFQLYVAPESYETARETLAQRDDLEVLVQELAMVPASQVAVDAEAAPQVLRLMEALEAHDDVQNVWANFEIDERLLAEVG